jgi:GAF domain-containing protein
MQAEDARRSFAAATAELARAMFHAKAASVLLLDEVAGELVFEGVSGEWADALLGHRVETDTGIAGSVLASGEAELIEDVAADERFARSIADAIGYVPTEMMAAPLVWKDRTLGVIEVLDRPQFSRFSAAEVDLLRVIADQAAIALSEWTPDLRR